ncbi:hypothetical protein IQ235_05930 [Oscillatoriales cyanobacterium LEGE 11467]|uniref:Uncharacterized protein n=1 Tax=Zarconia navalis LEGE 11467 TaxID=1828826 RepID=A0A928Z7A1_9CYAN|nr:hypothetical protein [Zarconia navalis]MBE9040330.1 hypothetical protein [Zarconia navalis LEGE 11467]
MTTATSYPNAPDLNADNYVVVGLATCFIREEGETVAVQILEPIPSAALETILKKIPTSYEIAYSTTLGEIVTGDEPQRPSVFPATAQFCDEFADRAFSAARTYKSRPEAQEHIPLGTTCDDFNHSVERKRVLNSENIVTAEDNVKQHSHTHQVL